MTDFRCQGVAHDFKCWSVEYLGFFVSLDMYYARCGLILYVW